MFPWPTPTVMAANFVNACAEGPYGSHYPGHLLGLWAAQGGAFPFCTAVPAASHCLGPVTGQPSWKCAAQGALPMSALCSGCSSSRQWDITVSSNTLITNYPYTAQNLPELHALTRKFLTWILIIFTGNLKQNMKWILLPLCSQE